MTVFLDTPVDKSPSTGTGWVDIDMSSEIPEGATGAIFQIENVSEWYYGYNIRKKGSTDNRFPRAISPYASKFAIIGIDSNRKCQVNVPDLLGNVKIFLVGYTQNDAVFFTNGYNKSQTTTGAWTDLDLSTELPDGAVAAVFEIENASTSAKSFGIRKKGSSDDRYGDLGASYPNMFFIVGVDSNRECQYKIETVAVNFYLLGYLKAGEAETNGVNRSLGSTGSYIDITESDAPANTTGVFVEFDTTSVSSDFAARKNGSGWDKYCYPQTNKNMIFVGLDGSKKWEGKIATTAHDFYTLGYFSLGGVDKFSSDVGVGTDALSNLQAAVVNAETGAGVDSVLESLSSRVELETGVGVDVLLDLLKAIAKYSSDTGVGTDAILECLAEVVQTDQGLGIESLGSRVFGSQDEGVGVDEILELALSGADSGIGSDDLKALLVAVQESDTGVGKEASAVEIYIYLLLKLLQKKGLKIELAQE